MSDSIQICVASPADLPVLETLRDTVFSEFGHRSMQTVAESLAGQPDLHILLARDAGELVGFSAGVRRQPGIYYVNFMAIVATHRGHGLGRRLMGQQEDFARGRGYESVQFTTFNHFPRMMRLGVAMGYRPVGLDLHTGTQDDLALRFGKTLAGPDVLDEQLRAALSRGEAIVGLVRDESARSLRAILQSEAT